MLLSAVMPVWDRLKSTKEAFWITGVAAWMSCWRISRSPKLHQNLRCYRIEEDPSKELHFVQKRRTNQIYPAL